MCAWLTAVASATGMLIVLCLPPLAAAQSAKDDARILAEAAAAFEQGVQQRSLLLQSRRHFSTATDRCLDLHRRGIRNPALYASLGNAATLADRWPEAIWAYHVGLALDPNDAGLREHLALVRGKVATLPSGQGRLDTDSWPDWLHRPTIYELFCISVFSYMLTCTLGTWFYLARSHTLALATLAAFGLTAAIGIGAWREWARMQFDRDTPLVVIAENTPLYRGNAVNYPHHPSLALLYRGMEVRQIHRRGEWLQVRASTGEIGWLPAASVLIVEP